MIAGQTITASGVSSASPRARRSAARLIAEVKCRGGPRPGPGGGGPGCLGPGRGRLHLTQRAQVDGQVTRRRPEWRGGPRPGPGGCGPGCLGPGRGRPAPRPARAGRWPGYWRSQSAGVVLAQDPAAAVQGVLVQVAGGLHLAQRRAGRWPGYSRRPRCRVVLAQDPAAAVQGVLVQVAGGLRLAQLAQVDRRVGRRSGCLGGLRPGRGASGPGCPGPGRGLRRSGRTPGAPRRGRCASDQRVLWSSPSRPRHCW